MKKQYSVLLASLFFLSAPLMSQKCEIYDDYKVGTSVKMVHYDEKDKPTGFTITTVKDKQSLANGVEVLFHQKYDNNDEYTFESEFSVKCDGGNVTVDMGKMVDPNTMTAYENMEYEVVADDLSIPSNAAPGDKLNDGTVTVTVNTGTPVKVTISATVSERMVVSKEKVETPAGSFDCLKISYDVLSQIGFIKIKTAVVEYYSKKHGVIKSESYNKKRKLTGYTVVEELKL